MGHSCCPMKASQVVVIMEVHVVVKSDRQLFVHDQKIAQGQGVPDPLLQNACRAALIAGSPAPKNALGDLQNVFSASLGNQKEKEKEGKAHAQKRPKTKGWLTSRSCDHTVENKTHAFTSPVASSSCKAWLVKAKKGLTSSGKGKNAVTKAFSDR